MRLDGFEVRRKDDCSASIIIQYVQRIINNNKNPESWTEEERKNPRIFDKQIQTYIRLDLALAKNKESAKMLSGGNFDFKDNIGSGYYLELKYKDNDDAVKEVIKCIREKCGFSCISGKSSASCSLAQEDPRDNDKAVKLEEICSAIETYLDSLK